MCPPFLLFLLPHGSIIEGKIIGTVAGLGVLEHTSLLIKGLAGYDTYKVVILKVKELIIGLTGPLGGYFPSRHGYGDIHVIFKVLIYG